jgi:hypothetical protein
MLMTSPVCKLAMVGIAMCCALLLVSVSSASAQTERKLGLVLGYPAAAGLQWQLNDRFTIRGDGAFSRGSTDTVTGSLTFSVGGASSTSSSTTTLRHSSASIGVSTLVTLHKHDQLRLYLAPRISWVRSSSSIESTAVIVSLPGFPGGTTTLSPDRSSSTSANGLGVDGMFGANYRLGDRFEVFGEAGISYVNPASISSSTTTKMTSYSIASRSDLGIVIRF